MKFLLTVIALLTSWAFLGPAALAFHEAGVANCNGCHTMHNSQDGSAVDPDSPGGSTMLLKNSNSTDVCLDCHATSLGSVLGSNPTVPPPERGAGNFVFLHEDNINDAADGAINPIPGHVAGHNTVSTSYGINPDPIHILSPGGSYPSSALTCTSCHDPHGNQNYRMLRGEGLEPNSGMILRYPAPEAAGIDLYFGSESPTNHTAYQSGWTRWCENCHQGVHDEKGNGVFEHPIDKGIGGKERDSYNDYAGPLDPTGGSFATAYLPEVPLENVSVTISSTFGATSGSRLSCMTCHRAHATSAPKSTRWDPNVAYLDLDGVESGSFALPNPYSDPNQRALCVKCHYKESTKHGEGQACLDCHRDLQD